MIEWPSELDQYFQEAGFAYSAREGVVRDSIQTGFPQARSTHSDVVWDVTGKIFLPYDQFESFSAFYATTLAHGALRFRKADPVEQYITWEWRFTKPFAVTALGGEMLQVNMVLERCPATYEDAV